MSFANAKKYWKKTVQLIVAILVSLFLSYLSQPLINEKALDTLVNIYSILAGFLVGIIALIGDPLSLPSGSWRVAEKARINTRRNLKGTRNLLYIYLLTLFFIFSYKLFTIDGVLSIYTKFNLETDIKNNLIDIKLLTERFILFLSYIAFFYSFMLPSKLFQVQEKRVDKEIEERRKKANINNNQPK
ncbi:hypothetical protein [Photobacterium halotolerans]|uniref:hypothetical protein n=1 Tax=Photobacterium halotolerans TaxID=265726 RepID=UPI0004821443|nr:hypothetical protein [Photobacterium halotolerans]